MRDARSVPGVLLRVLSVIAAPHPVHHPEEGVAQVSGGEAGVVAGDVSVGQ